MSIASRDDLLNALSGQRVYAYAKYGSFSGALVNGLLASWWKMPGQPGAAGATPTTPTLCSAATPGAFAVPAPGTGQSNYLANFTNFRTSAQTRGPLYLFDRLSHRGGLSGTVSTAQTVGLSLPSRVSDKTQVQIFLEINTPVGSTSRTVSISYTNEAGVSGRTAKLWNNTTINNQMAGSLYGPCDLQAGDLGVTSVETLTLSGSTGTAGDFSVVLMRPVAALSAVISSGVSSGDQITLATGGLYDLGADPCLMLAGMLDGGFGEVGQVAVCQG
ncbi:MAG TPA: hypothetical protein VE326_11515 [Candidatus Binatia bacterium]|nr:hypothetical protein [Candidatus Binatia bacterium]